MAVKLATTNGNLTTAGTWQDVANLRDYTGQQVIDQTMRGATAVTPGAIQIDGLVIKFFYRSQVAPSGTVSVELYNSTDAAVVAGTTVSINSSDLPLLGSIWQGTATWTYLKFAAPVTLTAGKAYYPRLSTSAANQGVYVYYSGTNYAWAFGFVLTGASAAAPTTGDQVMIGGAWTAAATKADVTVTMDQTNSAIKYGTTSTTLDSVTIGNGGTLSFGVAAATNYYCNIQGIVHVARGGTLNVGTVANPIPRDSTATLNFDVTGLSGSYYIKSHGTITFQGLSRTSGKNVVGCLLTANHVAGGTSWTVDRDTGWKSGDGVIIAGTQRASNKADELSLTVDAGATTLTTGASSFDHAGDAANELQAEVILTTRNVVCRVTTSAKNSFIATDKQSSFDADWAAFVGMSFSYSGAYRGICYTDPAAFGIDYCHFDGFATSSSFGFSVASSSAGVFPAYDLTFTNITFTRMLDYLYYENNPTAGSAITLTFEDCWGVGQGSYYAAGFAHLAAPKPVRFVRCRVAGGYSANVCVTLGNVDRGTVAGVESPLYSFQDCAFHDMPYPIYVTGTAVDNVLIDNCFFWRLKTTGSLTAAIGFTSGVANLVVKNSRFLSAQHSLIYHNTNRYSFITFRDCKFGGETSYSTPDFFMFASSGGQQGYSVMRFENCLFGDAAGGVFKDATTSEFSAGASAFGFHNFVFVNCLTGSPTKYGAAFLAQFQGRSYMAYQREEGVLGTHRIYYPRLGVVARDAAVYRSSPASEKMTPATTNANFRLQSQPKRFDVTLAAQRSPSVWVRIDAAYNGSAPRLVMRANPAIGQDDDVVLASHSLVTGSWVQLTGAMPTPSEDEGQVEVFVDCTGTAGNVWVDDWSI